MSHMVIFRSAEGKPGYHQADSLDEAIRFVEHLRNQESVTESRIFRMQEVPIEFKTYVKVEVAGAPVDESPAAPEPVRRPVEVEEAVPASTDSVVVEPVPAGASSGMSRFGRFNKS